MPRLVLEHGQEQVEPLGVGDAVQQCVHGREEAFGMVVVEQIQVNPVRTRQLKCATVVELIETSADGRKHKRTRIRRLRIAARHLRNHNCTILQDPC